MRHLTILMYHSLDSSGSVVSVPATVFARQMSGLAESGYRGISLREALRHRTDNSDWPQHSVVITFDDGYATLHESALPEMSRLGFGATVFLVSDFVGRRGEWAAAGVKQADPQILSWSQLRELSDAGFEIAAHTLTHPDLTRLSLSQMEHEINASRDAVRTKLNTDVDSFAYPYGRFDHRASAIVKRSFRAGCTTVLRRAHDDDASELPRIDMYYFRHVADLTPLVEGSRDGFLTIRRWGRRLRPSRAL